MAKRQRPTRSITHSTEGRTAREVITCLRENAVIAHPAQPDSDIYVKAPETDGVIREFPAIAVHAHAEDWQQTSLGPLALTRELRRQAVRLVTASQTPFAEVAAQP